MNVSEEDIKRFWSKSKYVESGCLEWDAGCFKHGYGAFQYRGKVVKAHRFAYELSTGISPEGKFVCHHCDNPKCISILHLFLGDAKSNNADMISKGRYKQGNRLNQPKGENHHKSILTEESVRQIRRIGRSKTQAELAVLFKCSKQTISAVLRNEIWKFVKQE